MKELAVNDLVINPITLFSKDWCIVAAGNNLNGYDGMTVSWGHLGAIWASDQHTTIPTVTIYARPQRHTKHFLDSEEYFTISTFDNSYRKALAYMGSHSGKDEDKIANAGLTPLFLGNTVGFEGANMIFVCRKLYNAPILESGFVDKTLIDLNYPKKDFHDLYIGEIVKIYIKD